MMLQNKIIILNPYFFFRALTCLFDVPLSIPIVEWHIHISIYCWPGCYNVILHRHFPIRSFSSFFASSLPSCSLVSLTSYSRIRTEGGPNYYSGESLYSDYFQSADDRWRFMWSWSQLTRLLGWLLALLTGWLKC